MRILIFILILIFGCTKNPTINVNIDNSGFESHKDFYCKNIIALWRPENTVVLGGPGDFVFFFEISKKHLFLSDSIHIEDISFYFELDSTRNVLFSPIGSGGGISTEGNNFLIKKNLFKTDNSTIIKFVKMQDKRLKIELFKDIISHCKIYAIGADGKRIDFGYTKETKFRICKDF